MHAEFKTMVHSGKFIAIFLLLIANIKLIVNNIWNIFEIGIIS